MRTLTPALSLRKGEGEQAEQPSPVPSPSEGEREQGAPMGHFGMRSVSLFGLPGCLRSSKASNISPAAVRDS